MNQATPFAVVALIVCCGCSSQDLHPGTIRTYGNPQIRIRKSPEASFDRYQNFALFPWAEIAADPNIDPIIEKQLLFMVRNQLELLGYNYVGDVDELMSTRQMHDYGDCTSVKEFLYKWLAQSQTVDFLVSVYYSNEYESEYIPPSSTTIPWYVPPQTSNVSIYGSSGYSWGTITRPGYHVPMTVTRGGYHAGAYYPYVTGFIEAACGGRLNTIWYGNAIVATPQYDIRLSCQALLPRIFLGETAANFPKSSTFDQRDDSEDGAVGLGFQIITLDGNNFYPHVTELWCGSPAHKVGLKIYDTVIEIDGQSTLNWSLAKLEHVLNRRQGAAVLLTIKRSDRVLDVSLMAEDEAIAKATWHKVRCPNEKGDVVTRKMPIHR